MKGLQVGTQVLSLRDVFIGVDRLPGLCRLDGIVLASRHNVNADDLALIGTENRGNGQGEGVVVRVQLVGVLGVTHVQEALVHALIITDTVRAVDPGVADNSGAFGKL